MKRYLKNLFLAICGKSIKIKDATEQKIADYQALTENLRKRIAEKDAAAEDIKSYYRGENGLLQSKIKVIQEEKEQSDRMLGRMMQYEQMLKRTNEGLVDIVTAIEHGGVDDMLAISEDIEWNPFLKQINKEYVSLLRRKEELERRCHRCDDNFNLE